MDEYTPRNYFLEQGCRAYVFTYLKFLAVF